MLRIISARCSIEAQAFGANNNSQTRNGFVKLNGVAVWQASWRGEHPISRGANMFVVDTSTCTLQQSRRFDTYGDRGAAAELRDYVQRLSDGTVLVGVSADEASRYLDEAEATLSGLGAHVSDVGHRGAWVFVAEIGDPSKTVLHKELTEAAANARQPSVTVSFAGAKYRRSSTCLDEFVMPIAYCCRYGSWFIGQLVYRLTAVMQRRVFTFESSCGNVQTFAEPWRSAVWTLGDYRCGSKQHSNVITPWSTSLYVGQSNHEPSIEV